MSKINPYSLKRPKKNIYHFEITDEANPGVVVKLSLRQPDIPIMTRLSSLIDEKTDLYFKTVEGEILPLPIVDGEPIDLNPEYLHLCCAIHCMQCQPPDDRFTVEELIALTETMPSGMMEIVGKVKELTAEFMRVVENPTRAVITPQSQDTLVNSVDTLN